MTTISRDRIQFEDIANEVADGNEQSHRDAAMRCWESAACDYLASHGGGEATVRLNNNHCRFSVTGDRNLADEADEAGWAAARLYIDGEIARVS